MLRYAYATIDLFALCTFTAALGQRELVECYAASRRDVVCSEAVHGVEETSVPVRPQVPRNEGLVPAGMRAATGM